MKHLLLILLFVLPTICLGYQSVTIHVEDLKRPDSLLKMTPKERIFKNLILDEAKIANPSDSVIKSYPYDIVAQGKMPDSLVCYGAHSFFETMRHAYTDHRPI
jgi:hypothetical protein